MVISVDSPYARVFFRESGEQVVATATLGSHRRWEEQIVAATRPATPEGLRLLHLALEASDLPLQESAVALTAAKVDLLPHQLVLTHRIATAPQRRFLIADDVGLGKTIETALVLRELASRGELTRALMVVPAGLVENWRRELNDVFRLDFEVFGSDGDVTDRKTNAFAKHNRLIASIDTLKRPERMKRLADAPAWDLVVFDEAQHLTATRSGTRVKKTENYRLGELLREHARNLLLLSATPHQGDHFRFLALVRLLHPSLFQDEQDMLDNRYRLNAVVVRRTKADACKPDGTPLFARRQVSSLLFSLTDTERAFYEMLTAYIRDGFNLAAAEGGKRRAIGFIMTVFQKIAASSFAAVGRTLERRLLSLTVHEALARDAVMDVVGRDTLFREARQMLVATHGLDGSTLGRAEADRLLAEARVQLLRKLRDQAENDADASEATAASWEESAAQLVEYSLPEERRRIHELLDAFPVGLETKTIELLTALGQFWEQNPSEKIIIFTTYLGSVDTLRSALDTRFPDAGIEVLKGGDHGAKTAAERRFRRPDGPRVLICTAAGREGINLQFARILINHDLPWNPMDLEQRIGRIHRYGQHDTAQVYNLVSYDTIEGRVFLLLEEKIKAVASALGKVDEGGEASEDLRGQILGQLGERLSFNQLYQDALRDPTLHRTAQELEVALGNATQARQVVDQLFQDLEPFQISDYRPVDITGPMKRLRTFVTDAAQVHGAAVTILSETRFIVQMPQAPAVTFCTSREEAMAHGDLALLGLEHPLVAQLLAGAEQLPAAGRALQGEGMRGRCVAVWQATIQDESGRTSTRLYETARDRTGSIECRPYLEKTILSLHPPAGVATPAALDRARLLEIQMPAALRGSLLQGGVLTPEASFQLRLLAWLEAAEE